MRHWGKAIVFASAGIAAIILGYSRIYLGAHWMSDVLGGFLFGAVMTAAFGIAVEAVPSRRIMPLALAGVSLAAFLIAGSVHVSQDYDINVDRYAPHEAMILFDADQWRLGGWASIARRRVDIAGRIDEPFLVQWAGGTAALEAAMAEYLLAVDAGSA